MEPARQEVASQVQVVDKVLAEGKEALVGWEVANIGVVQVGVVSAPIAELVSHQIGTPCYNLSYPKCGMKMVRG